MLAVQLKLFSQVLVLSLALLFSMPNNAKQLKLTHNQQLFLNAEQAIKSKNQHQFKQISSQLNHYPLLSYLQRDQLLNTLDLSHAKEIELFLAQYENQPVTRKLRYKWLHWLAKNNHKSLFLKHYKDFGNTHLNCKQLEFRLKTTENKKDIYAKVQQIWLSPVSLPKACDRLFTLWQAVWKESDDLIWKRLLLSIKYKNRQLTHYLLKKATYKIQDAAKLLVKVNQQPKKLLKIRFKTPLTNRAKDIIQIGLEKLAWQNPNDAIFVWQQLGQNYQLNDRFDSLKRSISLSLAIEKDPKANSWLSSIANTQDSSVNQWLLSTALAEKNWAQIAKLAHQFTHNHQDADKWRYWQAVAETQLGQLKKAQSLFKSLAKKRQYYGFLAARQLNKSPQLSQKTISFSPEELQTVNQMPATIRAKEFYQLGRLNDARREWNYLAKNNPNDIIKLALVAHQWGWQHQAILAFARSKQRNDVEKRFPLEHFQLFTEQAKQYQIPVSWAYAITRQESAFKTDAISSAGARGLMQLKPSTARYIAKKSSNYHRASQLLKADTNIKLGTAYLSKMYESFYSHPILATAAYNAGKTRVLQWLQKTNTQDPLEWIEQIPYKETREYVKNVLTYQLIYAKLTNQQNNFIAEINNYPITNRFSTSASR